MSRDEIRATVLRVLGRFAPEADLARLDSARPIRDQLDVDSIDFMRFLIALDEELHVDIPEVDYPKVATLNGCVDYVARALEGSGP